MGTSFSSTSAGHHAPLEENTDDEEKERSSSTIPTSTNNMNIMVTNVNESRLTSYHPNLHLRNVTEMALILPVLEAVAAKVVVVAVVLVQK